ncbi:MAG: substrate-binding domain-containing protein [Pseudomonadota bacterium]
MWRKTFLIVVLISFIPLHALAGAPIRVTFINPGGSTGFWGSVVDVMKHASESLGVDLEVLHSNRDHSIIVAHAASVAERAEPPNFVIIVNELKQGERQLELFAAAGIPTYFLLNTIEPARLRHIESSLGRPTGIVGSIVPDNRTAGYEMLMALVDQTPSSAQPISVLAILGDEVTPAALEREAGLRQAANELENVQIVRAFSVLWDADTAFQRVRTAIGLIRFDVIWAANDDLALAAHRALQSCDMPD